MTCRLVLTAHHTATYLVLWIVFVLFSFHFVSFVAQIYNHFCSFAAKTIERENANTHRCAATPNACTHLSCNHSQFHLFIFHGFLVKRRLCYYLCNAWNRIWLRFSFVLCVSASDVERERTVAEHSCNFKNGLKKHFHKLHITNSSLNQ